jgi:general L-amino acid transport system permease protein
VALAFLIGIIASIAVYMWARRRQMATGQQFPIFLTSLGLILGLPLVAYLLTGMPLGFDYPEFKGFNFQGGMVIQPEFMALLLGLSIYPASFIAEIVRAGIMGVSKGQKEAARAIGLTNGQMLRLVVIPQAARIIIPPLTSQYLNLTKNSSLAVAIGYPDFVSVFTGTVLNQTGQAVEIILLTMGVFLTISLLTSAFMNWFNTRMALVER